MSVTMPHAEIGGPGLFPGVFQSAQLFHCVLSHPMQTKMIATTRKLALSISGPTCGVAASKRCLLHSASLRSEPHLDRKLVAAEAFESKRIHRLGDWKADKYRSVRG